MERLCKSLVVLLVGHHLATVEQCVVVTVQGEEAGWMCATLAGFQHKGQAYAQFCKLQSSALYLKKQNVFC